MAMTEKALTEVQALCDQAWAEIGEIEDLVKAMATTIAFMPPGFLPVPWDHQVIISRCLNLVAGELIVRRCRGENIAAELEGK